MVALRKLAIRCVMTDVKYSQLPDRVSDRNRCQSNRAQAYTDTYRRTRTFWSRAVAREPRPSARKTSRQECQFAANDMLGMRLGIALTRIANRDKPSLYCRRSWHPATEPCKNHHLRPRTETPAGINALPLCRMLCDAVANHVSLSLFFSFSLPVLCPSCIRT